MTGHSRLLVLVAPSLLAWGCHGGGEASTPTAPAAAKSPTTAPIGPATLQPKATLETTLGDFIVELDGERAPATVANFIDYATAGFYDGTIFHRVVEDKLIQGGGFTPDMREKTAELRPPVQYEGANGLKNKQGTIAMFRRPEDRNSAQSQFFINVADNGELDSLRDSTAYTVFGRVIEGLEVVDRIRHVPVGTHPQYAAGRNPVVPREPVVLKSVRLITAFDRAKALAKAEDLKRQAEATVDTRVLELENDAGSKAVTLPSTLRYIDFRIGNGEFPSDEDSVEINFRGTLVGGHEYDSSKARGEGPYVLRVGGAIRGLREGLQTMREGGRRVLIIPPELGFGAEGVPGKVPAGATLFLDVELVHVRRGGQ